MSELVRQELSYDPVAQVRMALAAATEVEEAFDVLAKVKAATALFKAYKQLEKYRLDLLIVEVEALAKIIQLGGDNLLHGHTLRAARAFAIMTVEERSAFIAANSQGSANAAGMYTNYLQALRDAEERAKGRKWARNADEEEAYRTAQNTSYNERAVRGVFIKGLQQIVSDFIKDGQPFSVDDVVDELHCLFPDDWQSAGEFLEGVKEVVRTELRRWNPGFFEGVRIPKVIAVQTPSYEWVRMPTSIATLTHMKQSLELRRQQIREDTARADDIEAVIKELEPFDQEGAVMPALIAAWRKKNRRKNSKTGYKQGL